MVAICVTAGSLALSHARPLPAAPVTWIIFVDDLHIDFRNTGYLRNLLTSIATELIKDGDSFALRSSGPSSLSIARSTDRAVLDAAIRKVAGNGLTPGDVLGRDADDELRYRAKLAGTAASELLASLTRDASRRAALLYVSDGYDRLPPDATVVDLPRAAKQFAVTVFALNPRGLRNAASTAAMGLSGSDDVMLQSLRAIAEPTGGFAVLNETDFTDALQRIERAMR
jgi:hypothetical protein